MVWAVSKRVLIGCNGRARSLRVTRKLNRVCGLCYLTANHVTTPWYPLLCVDYDKDVPDLFPGNMHEEGKNIIGASVQQNNCEISGPWLVCLLENVVFDVLGNRSAFVWRAIDIFCCILSAYAMDAHPALTPCSHTSLAHFAYTHPTTGKVK